MYASWLNKRKKGIITVETKAATLQRKMTTSTTTTTPRQRKITVVSLASHQHGIRIEGSDAELRSRSMSTIRLDKVISEIKEFHWRTENQLKKSVKKQAKELGWFFAIFVIYIMFGTFLFFYIEECSGASTPNDNSIPYYPMEISKHNNLNKTCLDLYDAFIEEIVKKSDLNVTLISNQSGHYRHFDAKCQKLVMDSPQPFSFSAYMEGKSCEVTDIKLLKYAEFTIFTLLTIGYGNTTPITTVGRVTLVFYAVFGIPLAVTMYSVAGKLIVQIITLVIRMIQTRIFKNSTEVPHIQLKTLFVSIFFMLTIMLTGCAVTTSDKMEDLAFTSSFYFWFVSLSTIGYGDIHFDRRKHLQNPHLMILSSMNLLFGLGIMAAIIEAFSLALEKKDLQMSTIIIDDEDVVNEDERPESDKDLWATAMKRYRTYSKNGEQESETNLTELSSKDGDTSTSNGSNSFAHNALSDRSLKGTVNLGRTDDNENHIPTSHMARLNVFQVGS